MTYEFITIERDNRTQHFKGIIQMQGRQYRFFLWNTSEPQITENSFLTIEDDDANTLGDTLDKEFAENPLHKHPGIETEVAGKKFRTRTQLHPANLRK